MRSANAALLERNRGPRERFSNSWGSAESFQHGFLPREDYLIGSVLVFFNNWENCSIPGGTVSGPASRDSAGGRMQPMHAIPARGGLNFDETPFVAIWEVTQSCDLACKHCRAAAQPIAHPDELTTVEGKALIDQIAAMGVPIFVFTGGDPLKRKDVFELIRYAADKGVQVALTPSATPLLTREAIFKLKEAGLPIQVHTTISRHNADDLDNLCALFEKLAIVMWNVFFLVPVGRGQIDDLLDGEEIERIFGQIYALSQRVNFQIKTTEAMHYRRYLLQHNLEERKMGHGKMPGEGKGHPGNVERAAAMVYEPGAPTSDAKTRTANWTTRRVNDGKGFLFISHVGNVYPSGFLPIHAGNIRETPLSEIYRNAPIFKSLRDTSKLEGKCGACEYKEICGGSRARAYALTGNPLAAEPCCIYQPKHWDPQLESEAAAFAKS